VSFRVAANVSGLGFTRVSNFKLKKQCQKKSLSINRAFEIFGTGHNVPENGNRKYIGTYQLMGGGLVFHCFELLGLS